jgi:drug/metabolite transporter (DMT)-like permease
MGSEQTLARPKLTAQALAAMVTLAMIAFAANSLLGRAALKTTTIDPASFMAIRLISGAVALCLIAALRGGFSWRMGSWISAAALFAYAAAFSFAYLGLPAAVGALVLFCAVQATMIGWGLWRGERMRPLQIAGFCLAIAGLVALLMPGLSAPPLWAALLMVIAGIAWGIYSLLGRGAQRPTQATAGNFLRAAPMGLLLCLLVRHGTDLGIALDPLGVIYAVLSGAITSGIGYAIWYAALPGLTATVAATIQLSVPVITALGGVAFLNEPVSLRLLLSSVAILGGIGLVIAGKQRR